MRPGVVCVPHGWGGRMFDPVGGGEPTVVGANRNLLVDRHELDPLSQIPAMNSTAVSLTRVEVPLQNVPLVGADGAVIA
jgi:formate dehydrogenase